jgi:ABC-type nitrate/sulfonate/bicarbonate transport system substrate-binding protein
MRGWLAVVVAALTWAAPAAGQAETLKIASPQRGSWEGAIPELGRNAGIFKKHGLELEILYTQGGGETLQVVVSGAVDIGLSAGTLGTIGAYAKGAPVRIIGASSTGSREVFWFVPAKSPLKSMHDLKSGQTIAYSTVGASSHINVLRFIKEYGLNAKPVRPATFPRPSPRPCPARSMSAGRWRRSCWMPSTRARRACWRAPAILPPRAGRPSGCRSPTRRTSPPRRTPSAAT